MAKVLVVDDSKFQRKKIVKILQSLGLEVVQASDGAEGLEMVQIEAPDFICLDLLMPEMDGVETLEKLRDLGVSTPVIVLTADVQDLVREQCQELGARAFLNKPPDAEELQTVIREILGTP